LKFGGSNEPTPDRHAINTGNVTAEKGNAKVVDSTEGGIETGDVTGGKDVTVEAKPRPQASDPKVTPPT
jgi:hypothetical protein